ncbi:MAG: gliding motility-associated C-terminal domain-containing protein [Chitinophaga sp.]
MLLLFPLRGLLAQQCSGSLGDPVFIETFGSAGTAAKPTLGPPLPSGITSYTYYSPETITSTTMGPYPGQYTISNTTQGYNNFYFVDRPDHTVGDGTGFCMVVDAQATPGQFFEKTITGLCAGTTFEFSAWIMNINPQGNLSQPSLRFDIMDANDPNGTPIASVSTGQVPYDAPGTWVRQAALFQMPSTTSTIILRIFSNTPSDQGNDIALDDIAFAACGPPFIFAQAPGIVCAGGTAELNVTLPAGSYTNFFYQLQNRPIGATNWTDVGGVISNGTDNQYTFNITNAQAGYEYRVVAAGGPDEIANEKCRVVSDPVELKIVDFSVGITGPSAVCQNESAELQAVITPAPGTGTPATGYTFAWESSPNGVAGWTAVAGNTTDRLNTGPLAEDRFYRVAATVAGCGGDGVSQVFKVTANPPVTATVDTIPGLCQGASVMSIPFSILSGNPDQYSVTAANMPRFVPVTNASLTISPLNVAIPVDLAPGQYIFSVTFRNSVTGCVSAPYTDTLTIYGTPTLSVAGPDQALCADTFAILAGNTPATGLGTWSMLTGPGETEFVDIHNPGTRVSGSVPGTYHFRWTITNGACPPSQSAVKITVSRALTEADAGEDSTSYNSGAFRMNANTPAVGTGAWAVVSGNAVVEDANDPNSVITIGPNTAATLAWVISNEICPPDADTVIITYTSQADIQVVKTVMQPPPYEAGQELEYLVEVTNAGPSDATNVQISDALPAGFTSSGITYAASGGAVIKQNNSTGTNISLLADIPATEGKISILISGTINPDYSGTLANTASAITPDVPDDNGGEDSIVIPVRRIPHLKIVKRAPVVTVAGNDIQFSLTAQNTGLGDAIGAVFTDGISDKLGAVSWTATATGKVSIVSGASGTGSAVSVTANLPAGDTGKLYILITGTVNASATGTITNVAAAAAAEPGVQAVSSNTTHTLIAGSPGLAISKSRPGEVIATAGEPVEYLIRLFNNGPSDAPNTVITDTVPAAITNVAWTTEVQGAAMITAGNAGTGNLINITGNIPAGSSNQVIIHVTGTIGAGFEGELVNTVTADPSAVLASSVTDTDIATVQRMPSFSISKNGPATAFAGDNISYSVDVGNEGPSHSLNTIIRDLVSPQLNNVSWTAAVLSGTAEITEGASGTGNNVQLKANINANSAIRIIINGTINPDAINEIRNDADVIPSEPDVAAITSNEVVTMLSRKAVLVLTKTGPDSAKAGSVITYVVTAKNNGPSSERNLTIADAVPGTLQNVTWNASASGNAGIVGTGSGSGNNIPITGNIGPDDEDVITITVRGRIDPAFSGNIVNTAVLTPGNTGSTGDTASKTTVVNRLPQLVISKTAPGEITSGDSIIYVIEVSNTGVSDAGQAVITDVVPATLSGVSWSTSATGAAAIVSGASGTGNNVSVTANIPAGNNKIFITVSGKTSASEEGTIVNTATVTPSEPVPPASDSAATVTSRIPEIAVTKSGPALLAAGQPVTYTVTVRNTGLSDASGLLMEDVVPAAVQQVSWTTGVTGDAAVTRAPSGTGNNVSITGRIAGGGENAINITITGVVDPMYSGIFRNTATAVPAEVGADSAVSAPVVTAVLRKTALRITKEGPPEANPGTAITYRLNVVNLGPSNATNAVITDSVSSLLRNVSWTATAGGGAVIAAGASGSGGMVRVTGDIPADSGNIVISITGDIAPDETATDIRNVAVATPSEPGMQADSSDVIITVLKKLPRLLISKIAPSQLDAGEKIIYVVRVQNTGPSDATAAVISDIIPAQVSSPVWTAVASGAAAITAGSTGAGNQLSVTANIPAGAGNFITITIQGVIQPGFAGDITNTAIADAAEAGIAPVQSTAVTSVSRHARLAISKTGPALVSAGGSISYTLIVTNSGPSNADNVTIKDVLPAGITGVSWTAEAANGAVITSGTTGTGDILITGNIPAAPQARIVVQVNGLVTPGFFATSITNSAIAVNDPSWATPAGDTATVITAVDHTADLRITKSGSANYAAGQQVQYLLRIQNNGPDNAPGVQVSDVMPTTLTNVTWMATATGNITNISPASGSGDVSLTADIPADGSMLNIIVTGTVAPTAVNNTVIANTATVAFAAGSIVTDPNPANNTSTVTSLVDNDPVIRISKSGPGTAAIGDSILYKVDITNGGSGNITGATISDIVPAGVTVASWTATVTGAAVITGPSSGTGNTVSTTANIPVGNNTISILISGLINNNAAGTIVNTASVTAGVTKQSSVTTVIGNATDVSVTKTGPQEAKRGETVTYTIRIANQGARNADSVIISDQVPGEITNIVWRAIATGDASVMDSTMIDSVGNNITLPAKIATGAGNYITIYVAGKVSDTATAGVAVNTAAATVFNLTDNNLANNSSSINTLIGAATGLRIRKSGPRSAAAGNTITYNVVVANNGPSDADNVSITDVVPVQVENTSWSVSVEGGASVTGPLSGAGNNVSTTADIPSGAGSSIVITINGTIDHDFEGDILNIAQAAGAGGPPVMDSVTTTVIRETGLRIGKAGPLTVTAGGKITYGIVVTNNGPAYARNVTITDTLDRRIENAAWTSSVVNGAAVTAGNTGAGNLLNATVDIPAANAAAVYFVISGTISPSAADTIRNTATAAPADTLNPPVVSPPVISVIEKHPLLEITKNGPARLAAGEPVNYLLHIVNNGLSDASNAVITDLVPAVVGQASWDTLNVTGGAAVISGGSGTGNNLSVTADIPAGASIEIMVNGKMDASFSGRITNRAIVTPSEPGNPPDTSEISTLVYLGPVLRIVKTGPAKLQSGETITYRILAANTGPSLAKAALIHDGVPDAIRNVTWNAVAAGAAEITGPTGGTGNVIDVTADLPPGAGNTVTITVTGVVDPAFRDTLKNLAVITPAEEFGAGDTSALVQTVMMAVPELVISKTAPDTAVAGQAIQYTIVVNNEGLSDAQNFTLTDLVPASIEQVWWQAVVNGIAVIRGASAGTGNNILLNGDLPAGDSNFITLTVNGVIAANASGTIVNEAMVTPAETGSDPQTAEAATIIGVTSNLRIAKAGPAKMTRGQAAAYLLNVRNDGPSDATAAVMTDTVPDVLTDVSWTVLTRGAVTVTGGAAGTGNLVRVTANIPVGDTNGIIIAIKGTVRNDAADGQVINTAYVAANGPHIPSQPVVSVIGSLADLSVQKAGTAEAYVGSPVIYHLTVNNNGPSAANGAIVKDILPAGITQPVVTVINTTGGASNIQTGITGNTVSATLGTFPAGAGATLQISGAAAEPGIWINTAEIQTPAGIPDADSSDNISNSVATVMLAKVPLQVEKTINPSSGPYAVGQVLTYNITVKNAGVTAVNPVVATDTLPAGDLVSGPAYNQPAKGNVTYINAQRELVWNIGLLNAGESVSWSYTLTVTGAGKVRNEVIAAGPPDVSEPDTAFVLIETGKFANLKVVKQLNTPAPLNVNQVLQFSITATNNGPDTATDIVMRDQLASMLGAPVNITATSGEAAYDAATRSIVWRMQQMSSGASETLVFTVRLITGGEITNTAVIQGAETDIDLSDNTFTITPVPVTGEDIFIPNIITPNGDGKNDYFVIRGLDRYPGSTLAVYNRWGNQVYQNKNYDNRWDALGLTESTYFYILKVRTPQGDRDYKGWVEVVR